MFPRRFVGWKRNIVAFVLVLVLVLAGGNGMD
jgi:hypothetical protein